MTIGTKDRIISICYSSWLIAINPINWWNYFSTNPNRSTSISSSISMAGPSCIMLSARSSTMLLPSSFKMGAVLINLLNLWGELRSILLYSKNNSKSYNYYYSTKQISMHSILIFVHPFTMLPNLAIWIFLRYCWTMKASILVSKIIRKWLPSTVAEILEWDKWSNNIVKCINVNFNKVNFIVEPWILIIGPFFMSEIDLILSKEFYTKIRDLLKAIVLLPNLNNVI